MQFVNFSDSNCRIFLLANLVTIRYWWLLLTILFYILSAVRVMRSSTSLLVITMGIAIAIAIAIATVHITFNYAPPAYAKSSVFINCGPAQESSLSINVSLSGFLPNTFIHYKFVRPDDSIVSGGFSAGTYGKNTAAINVGAFPGPYSVYIFKDINSYGIVQPIYTSTITLPCLDNHYTVDYYKVHPQVMEYLLGIQSLYNRIKLNDYSIFSSRNALDILNSSNSNFAPDQLAAQLFAAELNIAGGGAGNCIHEAISSSNALLKSQNYNGADNFPITAIRADLQKQMLSFKNKLETYNLIGCSR